MKYKPDCYKMQCRQASSVVLSLPTFGPVYFCATHGLDNLRLVPEGLLGEVAANA